MMGISKRTRFQVFVRDNFTCQYCGRSSQSVQLEVDHRTPRSRGGSDDVSNLVTSCYDCNRGKRDDMLLTSWSLDVGPEAHGPLDGQSIMRGEEFPVLWVFRAVGGIVSFPDEFVATRLHGWPYEDRLRYGHPASHTDSSVVKSWHDVHRTHGAYPKLIGMYLPNTTTRYTKSLYWHAPAECLERLALAIPPESDPDA